MMEVSYAPDMFIRSDYYGADEFFEIQGTRGFIWVTRLCGNLHQACRRSCSTRKTAARRRSPSSTRSYDGSFRRSATAFVDALLAGEAPDLDPEVATRALQLCFAVYQASNERRPVELSSIDGRISPNGWPPSRGEAPGRRGRDVPAGGRARRAPRTRASLGPDARRIRPSTTVATPAAAPWCSRSSRTPSSSRSSSSGGFGSGRSRSSPTPRTWPPTSWCSQSRTRR